LLLTVPPAKNKVDVRTVNDTYRISWRYRMAVYRSFSDNNVTNISAAVRFQRQWRY